MKIYTAKYLNTVNNKYFFTSRIEEIDEYGTFYFLTQPGEVGKIDCLNAKPAALNEIEKYLNSNQTYLKLEGFEQLNILQDAWRFFTDKSKGGHMWYLGVMFGVPEIGGLFTVENKKLITKVEVTERNVDIQKITFNNWHFKTNEEKKL